MSLETEVAALKVAVDTLTGLAVTLDTSTQSAYNLAVSTATTRAGEATTQASAASDSAAIATAQAGIATSQASAAAASAVAALASQNAAAAIVGAGSGAFGAVPITTTGAVNVGSLSASGKTGIALTNNSAGLTEIQVGNNIVASSGDGTGVGFYFNGSRLAGIRSASKGGSLKTTISAWSGSAEVEIVDVSSTGAAITGALSSSGAATAGGAGGANDTLVLSGYNAFGHVIVMSGTSSAALDMVVGTQTAIPLIFFTNGTEKARIDAAGNLALGTVPSAWNSATKALQIGANRSASLMADDGYYGETALTTNAYLQTGSYGWKYVAPNEAARYSQNGPAGPGTHSWYTAPSGTVGAAISFTQSLAVGLGTTLALEGATSAAGTGIAFPATQVASADANTLDDYEEGTWTPTIQGLTTGGSTTYTTQTGSYVKVGKQVTATGILVWTAATGTGSMVAGGLPFTGAATGASASIGYAALAAGDTTMIMGLMLGTASYFNLYKYAAGAAAQLTVENTGTLYFSITYFV